MAASGASISSLTKPRSGPAALTIPNNTNALAALPEVRKLVFAGQYDEASRLISSNLMAVPLRQMPYQTLGDLCLDFGTNAPAENYRRDLDLDSAVAGVSYSVNGVHFKREIFSSPVDQVIVIRLTADQPGQISFTAGLTTPQKAGTTVEVNTCMPPVGQTNDATLVLNGVNGDARGIKGALKFQARVRVLPDRGRILAGADKITVADADPSRCCWPRRRAIRIITMSAAIPKPSCKNQIDGAYAKWACGHIRDGWDTTLADHVAAHQKLFRRVALDLGATDAMNLPTDVRIAHFADGNDPQLATLYFQFARYLLISCSRPGGQPATLQGLWNDSLTPPWDSKYTININTEMNYWPAETCNLSECVEPLTHMVLELTQTGARTAKVQYGARGWVAHHNTDLWRATAPMDGPNSGMWPMGGAWLLPEFVGALSLHPGQRLFAPDLSRPERRRAILPRYAGRGTHPSLAGHLPVALAGKQQSRRQGHQHHRRPDDGFGNPARPL